VILENLQRQDPSAVQKIKGSIIDSAPVAVPDSQVKAVAKLRSTELGDYRNVTEALSLQILHIQKN
jgi:hypothetical protein